MTTPETTPAAHHAPGVATAERPRPVIEVSGARAHYRTAGGELPVLDGVDLAVGRGEVLAVVGPSGCGKTTLLRALQGLVPLSGGAVAVQGRAPGDGRAATGYVFQQPSLFPWWSVRKNVEFGLRLRAHDGGMPPARRRARALELLDLVGLGGFEGFRPAALSGGMQQRVNLARALAVDPAVLLLDEPFSAVDTLTRERLQRVLAESLRTLGTAAVIVTHDIGEAVFLGDRVAVMSERPGRITETFEVDEVRPRTEEFQHSEQLAAIGARVYRRLSRGGEERAAAAGRPRPTETTGRRDAARRSPKRDKPHA
ncbi:ABC transporter ATP-binding protein [Streptomyces sp. NPDC050560]|uniref:ABC transporter ATP-binding protein n=1 Tax=Streptomyces sp. NPDC050560 TaxID=3365630 RepID=UPI0037BE0F9A